jgi:hypothetical protein
LHELHRGLAPRVLQALGDDRVGRKHLTNMGLRLVKKRRGSRANGS